MLHMSSRKLLKLAKSSLASPAFSFIIAMFSCRFGHENTATSY